MISDPNVLRDAEGRRRGSFRAMASPWEVHVWDADEAELLRVTRTVAEEVQRIERKYSRYRDDGVTHAINHAQSKAVRVDAETARLLNFADALWQASEGRFDISTGVLRRAWTFDGSARVPTPVQIAALLSNVGWSKIAWDGESICLPLGMEIDFGGIGKEYAVDRALELASALTARPVLINGGGDLAANAPPIRGQAWRVGIDTGTGVAAPSLQLFRGALATSGDAHRFLLKDGIRYSHVLDPRTGCPVAQAARSVTVLDASCSQAGSHATIALLYGAEAERYLIEQGVQHWINRSPN